MASTKKGDGNPYVKNGKEKGFLSMQRLTTKGNVKNTAIETGKDLLIGVIGGGLAGAVIGKPSMLVGLGLTGAGHYMDNSLLKLFGIGLMASNGLQGQSGYSKEAIASRMQSYKGNLTEKLFIDKLTQKSAANPEATNGVGEVQYFNYPNDVNEYRQLNGELAALDNLDLSVIQSGLERMEGMEDEQIGDLAEVSELNL